MRVSFMELGSSVTECRSEINSVIERVLDSGHFLMGQEVEIFERKWAARLASDYCIGVANGLDAIRLALEAHGVQRGDEVIVPAHTFIATWLAVSQIGAIPVPVDVYMETGLMDVNKISDAISPKTKAIVPVHLYGQMANMDMINLIARNHGLIVIEDAAQAHGARQNGECVGRQGNTVAWSFYPGKNLGAIADAGAITTSCREVKDRLSLLRNYGSVFKYKHEIRGWNSRMDELNAAVLSVKLGLLDDWNSRRRILAENYTKALRKTSLKLPIIENNNVSAWHLYVVRSKNRERITRELTENGIGWGCHYPAPPHLQPAYSELNYKLGAFPFTEELSRTCFSLPLHPHLTESDQEIVISSLLAIMQKLDCA